MFKPLNLIALFILLSIVTITCHSKTVIIGFDGMDPNLAQQWMDSGDLPHFKKLAETGHFQSLATSNPAQSPVAWSSFATGLNPGEHGVFDFIHRDPHTFDPVYSISGFKQPETLDVFGWDVPMSGPSIYNKRLGKPFWLTAEQYGNKSSVLRVPVTYPPDNISSMLSGMGVPDLLGTQGTYTFYATKYINKGEKGGNIVRVKVKNNRIETTLGGPPNPFSGSLLSMPLIMEKSESNSMKITLDGNTIDLKEGDWSQWIPIDFSYAGVFSLSGMVRFHLIESFPRVKLYVSPVNINPESSELPIAYPPEFAKNLSDDIGLFHTLGMPEETWSLNDQLLDSEAFLEMIKTVLAEREKMFFRQLADDSIELLIEVFVQTDRVSHMFWRGHDPNHPVYKDTNELERNAIKWIYKEADRILGKTIDQLKSDDKLIVLSDHGFAPYNKHVNLNRWLYDNGFLSLKSNDSESFSLKDVNWDETQAYAMGLNGIYLNIKDREKFGSVSADKVKQIEQEIISKLSNLMDTENGEAVISRVFQRSEIYSGDQSANSPDLMVGYHRGYRASWQTVLGEAPKELMTPNTDMWSGDHCIDPELVPGVLFTNFKMDQDNINGIKNVGKLALSTLESTEIQAPEITEKSTGILDFPRDALMGVLKPLQTYLPSSVALVITGLILSALILLLLYVIKLLPNIIVISSLLKILGIFAITAIVLSAGRNVFSGELISQNDNLTILVKPIANNELPLLKWYNKGRTEVTLDQINKNHWAYQLNQDTIILNESDGYELITISNDQQFLSKVKKNWWHKILSNKGGYINNYSQVKSISVLSENNMTKYWWLWILISFIIATLLWTKLRKNK
ncbi:MAG: alkaline phosphatase family protein [Marinicellaceae bacterium]